MPVPAPLTAEAVAAAAKVLWTPVPARPEAVAAEAEVSRMRAPDPKGAAAVARPVSRMHSMAAAVAAARPAARDAGATALCLLAHQIRAAHRASCSVIARLRAAKRETPAGPLAPLAVPAGTAAR